MLECSPLKACATPPPEVAGSTDHCARDRCRHRRLINSSSKTLVDLYFCLFGHIKGFFGLIILFLVKSSGHSRGQTTVSYFSIFGSHGDARVYRLCIVQEAEEEASSLVYQCKPELKDHPVLVTFLGGYLREPLREAKREAIRRASQVSPPFKPFPPCRFLDNAISHHCSQ